VDLLEALRRTGAIREFRPEPVDDDVVYDILDTARFAPSGGNRQAWRVIVVRDPQRRRALRDLYLSGWYEYLAVSAAGLVPWAPVTDRDAERRALQMADDVRAASSSGPGGFAEHLDEVPVLLVLTADLRRLAAVDRDGNHYPLVAGASVYPFAWSILLAARAYGLGGVLTTMAVRREAEVRTLLGAPDHVAVAGMLALGYPVRRLTRLARDRVEVFATVDAYDGDAVGRDPV
jgi:nitroreductase